MFWEEPDDVEVTAINKILQAENCSLEDLIEEEFFTTQYENDNNLLVEFLVKPETLSKIVKYITTEPDESLDERIRFRKANIACGLFSSRQTYIENALLGQTELMDKMLEFLDQPPPLHPLLASFFVKAMAALLEKFSDRTVTYLKTRDSFFDKLTKHIETSAIMDLFNTISNIPHVTNKTEVISSWINHQEFISKIIDVFITSDSKEAHENASKLLISLIIYSRSVYTCENTSNYDFLHNLESRESIDKLLENIFTKNTASALVNGIKVIQELANCRKHMRIVKVLQERKYGQLDSNSKKEIEDSGKFFDCVFNVHEAIIPRLEPMAHLLKNPIEVEPIHSTIGIIPVPLGIMRLEIINLIKSLITVNNPKINSKIAELHIIPILFDLFFEYPWNNFLQNHVEQIFDVLLMNINPPIPQFVHVPNILNEQDSNEKMEKEEAHDEQENHETSAMEITTLDATNANASEMEITITEPNQATMAQVQPSLIEILRQILVDCDLLNRIMDSVTQSNSLRECEDIEKKRKPRPGYIGHLVQIANYLDEAIKKLSFFRVVFEEIVSAELIEKWNKFLATEIAKENEEIRTTLSCIQSEESFQKAEMNAKEAYSKFQMDHVQKPLTTNMETNHISYEFEDQIKHPIDCLSNLNLNFEESFTEVRKISVDFDQLCSESTKSFVLSCGMNNEEEETVSTENVEDVEEEKPDYIVREATGSDGDDSAFVSFFQPKASSSNLSAEIKMEIDPFLDLSNSNSFENITLDLLETGIWGEGTKNTDPPLSNAPVESWADFSNFPTASSTNNESQSETSKAHSNLDQKIIICPISQSTVISSAAMADPQVLTCNEVMPPPSSHLEDPIKRSDTSV